MKVDLNVTLRFALENLRDMIAGKQAVIEAESLPVVKGHCTMLLQVMQNIIANALKFQEPGNIPHISITATTVKGSDIKHAEALPDTTYHRISFKDNGIGFDKKYTQKAFMMFQRLHDGNVYPGTGIGLAICKRIADLHNGFIAAESEPGNGSTFTCYLPQENTVH